MNNVKIIGDSTCDLPPSYREKLDVGFMPLPVNVGDEPRLDMYDVFPDEIFDYYKRTGKLCTTSAPNTSNYIDFWSNLRKEDPTCEIVHFHISSEMTVTHEVSDKASKEFENVYSVDTRSVSVGVAILLMEACRLRDEGKTAKEIYDEIELMKVRVKVGFILDSVEFLYKGGRCTGLQALGANLLGLHPAINMVEGHLVPGKKYRGAMNSAYSDFISDTFLGRYEAIENGRVFIANTSYTDESNDLILGLLKKTCPELEDVVFVQPGCSICVHCGPKTLGYAYLAKE
jgi:DegV family protein with EDD domain